MSERKVSGSDRTVTIEVNGQPVRVRRADRKVLKRMRAIYKMAIDHDQVEDVAYELAAELCPSLSLEAIDALVPEDLSAIFVASAGTPPSFRGMM